jgi:formate dehydrogenase subunit gamma
LHFHPITSENCINADDREGALPEYEAWNEERAAGIIAEYANTEGPVLPILHALQEAFGFLSDDALRAVATALNLSRAEIYGIASFYHDFRRHPPGRHRLQLCRAEACQAVGGEALAEHAKQSLNVDWHGTTADGAITLEPVYCLGLCACGPSALLDGEPLGRLNASRLDAQISAVR